MFGSSARPTNKRRLCVLLLGVRVTERFREAAQQKTNACRCFFFLLAGRRVPTAPPAFLSERFRQAAQHKKQRARCFCFFAGWPRRPNGPACVSESVVPGGHAATINALLCFVFCCVAGSKKNAQQQKTLLPSRLVNSCQPARLCASSSQRLTPELQSILDQDRLIIQFSSHGSTIGLFRLGNLPWF